MLREEEVRLFDFLAGQAQAFSQVHALAGVGVVANSSTFAAAFYFLGLQRWNPHRGDFLQLAQSLDPNVATSFGEGVTAVGLQPARLNDMTRMRYQQLCTA